MADRHAELIKRLDWWWLRCCEYVNTETAVAPGIEIRYDGADIGAQLQHEYRIDPEPILKLTEMVAPISNPDQVWHELRDVELQLERCVGLVDYVRNLKADNPARDTVSDEPEIKPIIQRRRTAPPPPSLHWLRGWGKRLQNWIDDDRWTADAFDWTVIRPCREAAEAMLEFSIDFPTLIAELKHWQAEMEDAWKVALDDPTESNLSAYCHAQELLASRIAKISDLIGERLASETTTPSSSAASPDQPAIVADAPTEDEPDGPVDGYCWRHDGIVYENMTPIGWKCARALFNARNQTLHADNVYAEVLPDDYADADRGGPVRWAKNANTWFTRKSIPWRVRYKKDFHRIIKEPQKDLNGT